MLAIAIVHYCLSNIPTVDKDAVDLDLILILSCWTCSQFWRGA